MNVTIKRGNLQMIHYDISTYLKSDGIQPTFAHNGHIVEVNTKELIDSVNASDDSYESLDEDIKPPSDSISNVVNEIK